MVNCGDPSNDPSMRCALNANANVSISRCLSRQGRRQRGVRGGSWIDHRQVNQLDISTHVLFTVLIPYAFRLNATESAQSDAVNPSAGKDWAASWRELFFS